MRWPPRSSQPSSPYPSRCSTQYRRVHPDSAATAAFKLGKLAARLRSETIASEPEQAQRALLAADIKRFLERPADIAHPMPAPNAPPGAPIGEPAMDWLAPAPWK